MKMRASLVLFALALAGCQGAEDSDEAEATAQSAMAGPAATVITDTGISTDDAGYVARSVAGDTWEIDSAKIILAKSNNADVKAFASMLIEDHEMLTEKIRAAAIASNVAVAEPVLDAVQLEALKDISNADASEVDDIFLEKQAEAHVKARSLHEGYATRGANETLKTTAAGFLPVIERHINAIMKLAALPS